MTELAEKYKVGYQVVRTAVSQSNTLANVDSDASILLGTYTKKTTISKYSAVDDFILTKISVLREKGGIVNKYLIKSLLKDYNNTHNASFNISDYFVRAFVKRNKVFYQTLHGEAKSAPTDRQEVFSSELQECM